ncbi:2-oxo acid dehydrogenase subunit E2 [Vagococcus sp. BWB3-3]|uniref:Dihydrolipoamide acetyltransferase component of pyruvate dehydrogenase complex n=1 Tax=Vagococcus allomyrinae TaxID=2794353 RepID=A0A940PGK0_9ENTE|nr:dihydrolipoamide acetyltransferase family protein [Vagococcus allomyrinae]MBP1043548.1 2-oxo acid dehydrogenase subunit E2 [Vagococcus allomyrinae]
MAHEVLMPKLSSTMAEGSITQWFKAEGDPVEVGEAIFEVMTDKIAIEVEAYEEGILLKRYYEIDQSAPINSVVAYIGEFGEEVPEVPEISHTTESDLPEREDKVVTSPVVISVGKGIRATPAARKLAREKGLDLSQIIGSGTNGRIHLSDVQAGSPANKEAVTFNEEVVIPWGGMRRVIADRMTASKNNLPHVTMDAHVDLTEVVRLRQQLLPIIEEQTSQRVSYTEILIKAVTIALKQFPRLNARAMADGIHEFSHVNMGLAVSLEDGLVVPVIKNADLLRLSELTTAVKQAAAKARNGQLTGDQLADGTFTISSLGPGVVRQFNPVINAPEVAILGVSSIYEAPYQTASGGLEMRSCLTLSLSFDHRAIDGAPVAAFLSVLVELLECPYKLLV